MTAMSGRSIGHALVLLSLIGCFGVLHGCAAFNKNAAKAEERWDRVRGRIQLQLAEKQFDGGRFADAERTATESLALDPSHVATYVLLARAQLELGRLVSAERTVSIAENAGLASPALSYTRGVILEQRGDIKEALPHYESAAQMEPHNEEYLIAWAECLVAVGQEREALDALDSAIDKLDDRTAVGSLAAQIALLLGDRDGALDRYRRAGISVKDDALLAENFGLLLARAGRCAEAIPYLTQALDAGPKESLQSSARRGLAACYLELKDPARAKEVLEDQVRGEPSDTAAQLLLAKAALATNDMVTALEAVTTAERYDGHRPEVRFVRAVVRWKRGENDSAARLLKDLAVERPEDVDVRCLLGEVLIKLGDTDAARRQFEQALELDPRCVWAADALHSLG
ncbi:MAG: tetratricopeptide repeat protein [Phycisphaerae bacterium]|nr:tetratricopeptide repeat protein [Phycisphaerae bacterium]